jgi:hypothetical protein
MPVRPENAPLMRRIPAVKKEQKRLKIVAIFWNMVYTLYEEDCLSKKEKIIKRLLSRPVDFTFDELATLLGHLGFTYSDMGKTSGSRVAFVNDGMYIRLHKPHTGTLKRYQINDIITVLTEGGLL